MVKFKSASGKEVDFFESNGDLYYSVAGSKKRGPVRLIDYTAPGKIAIPALMKAVTLAVSDAVSAAHIVSSLSSLADSLNVQHNFPTRSQTPHRDGASFARSPGVVPAAAPLILPSAIKRESLIREGSWKVDNPKDGTPIRAGAVVRLSGVKERGSNAESISREDSSQPLRPSFRLPVASALATPDTISEASVESADPVVGSFHNAFGDAVVSVQKGEKRGMCPGCGGSEVCPPWCPSGWNRSGGVGAVGEPDGVDEEVGMRFDAASVLASGPFLPGVVHVHFAEQHRAATLVEASGRGAHDAWGPIAPDTSRVLTPSTPPPRYTVFTVNLMTRRNLGHREVAMKVEVLSETGVSIGLQALRGGGALGAPDATDSLEWRGDGRVTLRGNPVCLDCEESLEYASGDQIGFLVRGVLSTPDTYSVRLWRNGVVLAASPLRLVGEHSASTIRPFVRLTEWGNGVRLIGDEPAADGAHIAGLEKLLAKAGVAEEKQRQRADTAKTRLTAVEAALARSEADAAALKTKFASAVRSHEAVLAENRRLEVEVAECERREAAAIHSAHRITRFEEENKHRAVAMLSDAGVELAARASAAESAYTTETERSAHLSAQLASLETAFNTLQTSYDTLHAAHSTHTAHDKDTTLLETALSETRLQLDRKTALSETLRAAVDTATVRATDLADQLCNAHKLLHALEGAALSVPDTPFTRSTTGTPRSLLLDATSVQSVSPSPGGEVREDELSLIRDKVSRALRRARAREAGMKSCGSQTAPPRRVGCVGAALCAVLGGVVRQTLSRCFLRWRLFVSRGCRPAPSTFPPPTLTATHGAVVDMVPPTPTSPQLSSLPSPQLSALTESPPPAGRSAVAIERSKAALERALLEMHTGV